MFLSDRDIYEAIEKGDIKIDPFTAENVQPGSIDLLLGDNFLLFDSYHIDAGVIKFDSESRYSPRKGSLILPSKEFALGTTLEYISLSPSIVASVQGRSSIGRKGLFIQNAGWVDPGFEGNLTLEFFNASPLPMELRPGTRICQLFFGYTKTSAEHPYSGKYKGQRGTTGSRSYQDREYK